MIDRLEILRWIYEGSERRDIDFKRAVPWNKDTKFGLMKDVVSFANAGGGLLIIGYDEGKETATDRRAGMTNEDLENWDITKVNRDINNYFGPPLDVEIVRLEDEEEDRLYLIMQVPGHQSSPHVCIKDKHDPSDKLVLRRGALYCRTANKTCEEISDPEDMRRLIRRCVLFQREELLHDFERLMTGMGIAERIKLDEQVDPFAQMDVFRDEVIGRRQDKVKNLMFWEVICYPESEWQLPEQDSVTNALADSCWDYRGWPYLFYMPGTLVPPDFGDQSRSAFTNKPFNDYEKFNYWKFDFHRGVFYSQSLTHESSYGKPETLDPFLQVTFAVEAVVSMGRLFSGLGLTLDQELTFAVRYSPMRGAVMGNVIAKFPPFTPSPAFPDNELTFRKTYILNDMVHNPCDCAAILMSALVKKMGGDHRISRERLLKASEIHFARGHPYR